MTTDLTIDGTVVSAHELIALVTRGWVLQFDTQNWMWQIRSPEKGIVLNAPEDMVEAMIEKLLIISPRRPRLADKLLQGD